MLFLLAVIFLTKRTVTAFPTGAGGCAGPGEPAVGGSHVDTVGEGGNPRLVTAGNLNDGAIQVTIGDVVLDPNTVNTLPISEDLLVAVEALDIPYRGVLVRLQAPDGVDTQGALIPGANTKSADDVCQAPVLGITHTDRSEKTLATGTFRFEEEVDDIALDVTIVFINGKYTRAMVQCNIQWDSMAHFLPMSFFGAADEGSAYVHDSFQIQTRALGEPTVPPAAGTTAPAAGTAAPVIGISSISPAPTGSSSATPQPSGTPEPTTFTKAPTPTPMMVPTAPAPSQIPESADADVGTFYPTFYDSTIYPTYKKKPYPGKGKGKGYYPPYYGYGKSGMKGYYGKGKAGMSKGGYYGKGKAGMSKKGGYYGKAKKGMSKKGKKSSKKHHWYFYKAPPQHYYYKQPEYDDHTRDWTRGRSQELNVQRTQRRHKPSVSIFGHAHRNDGE